ncbi:DL-endopeptidase inhibitor IseA family protein [Clostridium oryzae]|uniref:Uncharacterized protein n=1 Tax=Clostridium oryzae TaxID=1450648 RepID=A0A1V4IS62_9CLOT|nr:DL-endopeptidase inhibitor IseA family protein [Clostridium oryzae]OPJ62766.1 hypothetical protein CLORY_16460 [Clostridium oryzae]
MKHLKIRKSILSFVVTLLFFTSVFGYTASASTKSKTATISNKKIVEISAKAYTAFRKLYGLGSPYQDKIIKVNGIDYGKLPVKLKSEKAVKAYVEKETHLDSYFTKELKNKILQDMIVLYKGNYYLGVGDPEIGIVDLSKATVKSKSYVNKSVKVTLEGEEAGGARTTSKLILIHTNGKWLISQWKEIS